MEKVRRDGKGEYIGCEEARERGMEKEDKRVDR